MLLNRNPIKEQILHLSRNVCMLETVFNECEPGYGCSAPTAAQSTVTGLPRRNGCVRPRATGLLLGFKLSHVTGAEVQHLRRAFYGVRRPVPEHSATTPKIPDSALHETAIPSSDERGSDI